MTSIQIYTCFGGALAAVVLNSMLRGVSAVNRRDPRRAGWHAVVVLMAASCFLVGRFVFERFPR